MARSQLGNNNCYCQDNELTWFDWNLDGAANGCATSPAASFSFDWRIPICAGANFFRTVKFAGAPTALLVLLEKDAMWFNPDGNEVSDEDWNAGWTRAIALLLNGRTLQVSDEDGKWITDDSFLLLINAADQGVEFKLPPSPRMKPWRHVIDTENIADPFAETPLSDSVIVGGRALKLLSDAAL